MKHEMFTSTFKNLTKVSKTIFKTLALCFLPLFGMAQVTFVPDDNFEQELINLGYDNVLDDFVTTANINTVTAIDVSSANIADMTGIADFTALTTLLCYDNQLSVLDISSNTNLIHLYCSDN